MGLPGWGQILLVVLLIVVLFGRGKISDLMGDVAKGIRSFKDGLKEDPDALEAEQQKPTEITDASAAAAAAAKEPAKEDATS
ncbi:MAG: twin-arginine translocase TatA/TatE family subunit [Pseudomonadota bacterium]